HLPILLGDDRSGGDEAGRIGAEQKLRLVLRDQARVELLYSGVLGLVIIAREIELVALTAGLDAACGIDLIAPQLDPAQLSGRIVIEPAGARNSEADLEIVLGERRRRNTKCKGTG